MQLCKLCLTYRCCLVHCYTKTWSTKLCKWLKLTHVRIFSCRYTNCVSLAAGTGTGSFGFQQTEGREWCTASLVPNVPAPTSAKQADPWMSAFGNTAGPWGMETLRPLLLRSMCFHVTTRLICQSPRWLTRTPTPKLVHAKVLAHPTPTGPTQQRQGYSARTLHCTVGLTQIHTLWGLSASIISAIVLNFPSCFCCYFPPPIPFTGFLWAFT